MKQLNLKYIKFYILIIIFILLFLYLQISVIFYKAPSFNEKADAIIILGHSISEGYEPSLWLVERLERGLSLYNEGFSAKIIVTGGKGTKDGVAVANVMKGWLVQKGVPKEDIIAEDRAGNTYENFKFTKELTEGMDIGSLIVVTNDFHMYRSVYIGELFFETVHASPAKVNFSVRKALAYLKEPFSLMKIYFMYI